MGLTKSPGGCRVSLSGPWTIWACNRFTTTFSCFILMHLQKKTSVFKTFSHIRFVHLMSLCIYFLCISKVNLSHFPYMACPVLPHILPFPPSFPLSSCIPFHESQPCHFFYIQCFIHHCPTYCCPPLPLFLQTYLMVYVSHSRTGVTSITSGDKVH